MKMHQNSGTDSLVIDSYADGHIEIGQKRYERCITVFSNSVEENHDISTPEDFTFEKLSHLIQLNPETILLGTGPTLRFPHPSIIKAFHQRGIGCDIMDSGAACRTYNILTAEGRSVAAVLLIP